MVTGTIPAVQAIMETSEEKEFWTVVREHERPPYYFPEEGLNNRLNLAARLVYEEHVHPQSDGSFQVDGSGGRTYRVDKSCSCPASQKSKSKWCKHLCAVALYVEWQRRLAPVAPVALGTLRTGTLPLPPVTAEARLAQAAKDARDHVFDPLPTPEEDRMADDPYIPEPDTEDAPVAVMDAPVPARALTPVASQVLDLEMALQTWTTERSVVRRFLKQELQANIDYYTLRIGGKDSKPSLSKAGAEKVMGWLKLQASFTPDTGTWEMLGKPQDLVCYVCTLRTRSGEIVGEGRGARSIKKDNGDVNKAIKMAEKSANVSAVLRTGCLSDVFTQDLGEDDEEPAKAATPAKASAQDLRQRIWRLVQAQAPEVKSREAVEAYIKERTGMDLHPDVYGAIVARLEEGR
jgi:SWIM zinc finger